jgi:hypothetical protein
VAYDIIKASVIFYFRVVENRNIYMVFLEPFRFQVPAAIYISKGGDEVFAEDSLRFVWYGTNYKVDAEPNNGKRQADFFISIGQKIKILSNSSSPVIQRLIRFSKTLQRNLG